MVHLNTVSSLQLFVPNLLFCSRFCWIGNKISKNLSHQITRPGFFNVQSTKYVEDLFPSSVVAAPATTIEEHVLIHQQRHDPARDDTDVARIRSDTLRFWSHRWTWVTKAKQSVLLVFGWLMGTMARNMMLRVQLATDLGRCGLATSVKTDVSCSSQWRNLRDGCSSRIPRTCKRSSALCDSWKESWTASCSRLLRQRLGGMHEDRRSTSSSYVMLGGHLIALTASKAIARGVDPPRADHRESAGMRKPCRFFDETHG